ncbi:hypothetical protein RND81_01G077700 [Saponaria officinalis]|uniref:Uncharacterized protein n=1 Tax=Saponaria officinalis TaxID=3572 RepID=A0AAW1NDJ2_SAPOF
MNSMREIPAQKSTKSSAYFLPETSKRAKLTKIGGLFITNEGCILLKYREKERGQALMYWDLGERERKQPLFLFSSIHLLSYSLINSFNSLLESASFIDYLVVPRDEQTIGTELKRAAGGLTPDTNKRTTSSPRTGVGLQKE